MEIIILTMIFVFGSNLAGRHGKGASLDARKKHGAVYGQGVGLQGNSYAIPTKDETLKTLPLNVIRGYVNQFLSFAMMNPHLQFQVTPVGCGLAGYKPNQIAPMFRGALQLNHVKLPPAFLKVLEGQKVNWSNAWER